MTIEKEVLTELVCHVWRNGGMSTEDRDSLLDRIKQIRSSSKPKGRVENTPDMIRIGKWFSRRETTKWSASESIRLKELGELLEEEMDVLEDYYLAEIPEENDMRRRSVETLLNNWPGELDRAREFWRKNAGERMELRRGLNKEGEPSW